MNDKDTNTDSADLRARAESLARQTSAALPAAAALPSTEEAQRTLYELRVHQIELEMQNDQLRRIQTELATSQGRYFDLYDMAPVGYITVNEQGLIIEANLTVLKLLGLEGRSELLERPLSRFILKDDVDAYYRSRKQLLAIGKPQECELRLLKKDGTIIWTHLSSGVARDANGARVSRVTLTDVTTRKQAEADSKEANERFRALFNNAPIGIASHVMIYDDEGKAIDFRFLDANKLFCDLTGVAPCGKTATQVFPGIKQDPFDWIGNFDRIARADENLRFEQHLQTHHRWYDIVGYRYKPDHCMVAIVEITNCKRAELDAVSAQGVAENANRAKSQFLANMSHELRTPLNPILGFADLLAESPNLTEEQRLWLRIISQRGQDLLRLIASVLDLAKIEADKIVINPEPLLLRQTLRDVVDSSGPAAMKKGLAMEWNVAEDVPDNLLADGLRLRQILLNLLNNAIKFTKSGGIAVHVQDGRTARLVREPANGEAALLLSVRDTGIGIAANRQAAVFEAFTQADPKEYVKYGGVGLGLAIVWRLVELMGGRVWVESEPGKGSTFWFTILVGVSPAPGADLLSE